MVACIKHVYLFIFQQSTHTDVTYLKKTQTALKLLSLSLLSIKNKHFVKKKKNMLFLVPINFTKIILLISFFEIIDIIFLFEDNTNFYLK